MSYPLIILGAGASHDCLENSSYEYHDDLVRYQPPLTDDLFNKQKYYNYINKYPEVSDLASDAATRVNKNFSLESYLTELQDQTSKRNLTRHRQLIALRFYLRELFYTISVKYLREVNHYKALIQKINDNADGNACFVNFNYDLLLERNIPLITKSNDINIYITGNLKIIKIHGSCNWVYNPYILEWGDYQVTKSYEYFVNQVKYDEISKLQILTNIKSTGADWDLTEKGRDSQKLVYLPAMAIPIVSKQSYVCPDSHIEMLKQRLTQADRVLVIGWRGNDPFLIDLMNKNITNINVPVVIVSRNKESGESLKNKLNTKFSNITVSNQEGFTNFMKSGECDNFLKK